MPSRFALAACVALLGIGALSALALAQGDSGPSSSDQGESFLVDGIPVLPEGVTDADDLPDVQRMKYEDALLEALEPAPDEDGDPRTIEGVLPDGREGVISIQTSKPELLEGIDVDELVERDTNDE